MNTALEEILQLQNNLTQQLLELESLQSMYYNPGELKIENPIAIQEINNFIKDANTNSFLPSELDLAINLEIDENKFQLYINLPLEYPNISPTIFVRNPQLNKEQNGKLNKDLKEFIFSVEKGEPCIFAAISWVQDNALTYLDKSKTEIPKIGQQNNENPTDPPIRLWIYSHHIYSKIKRREIISQAESLELNGFCMPGKPGIICVEGEANNCNKFWQNIKSMTWKRIFCKITEEFNDEKNFLKFNKFEEVSFQTNNARSNHMDIGELGRYLENHGCLYIFKDLFGVDAKPQTS